MEDKQVLMIEFLAKGEIKAHHYFDNVEQAIDAAKSRKRYAIYLLNSYIKNGEHHPDGVDIFK